MKAQSSPTQPGARPPDMQPNGVQVLKAGKRRIVGATKFGKDGCGY